MSERSSTDEQTPHAAAAAAFVDRTLDRFSPSVDRVYVFGSTARDEASGLSSDVDVLVVLADDADRGELDESLHALAYDVMLEYGPVVELHLLSEREFERSRDHPFVRHAVTEGRSYA